MKITKEEIERAADSYSENPPNPEAKNFEEINHAFLLNTGIADLLVVEVSTSASCFEILPDRLSFDYMDDDMPMPDYIELPEGYKYTVLGRADSLTEAVILTLVKRKGTADGEPVYEDYENIDQKLCWTATESFKSLLKANGILLENPYGEKPEILDYNYEEWMNGGSEVYYERMKKYEEAQSKITNPLILKAEKI